MSQLASPSAETRTPLYVHCKYCNRQWVAFYAPAPMEEVARFAKASCKCPACGKRNAALLGKYVASDATYTDYRDWLLRGESGVSSMAILYAITGIGPDAGGLNKFHYSISDVPHDPDDFRRCYLLLKAFPELREQLPKVADKFPAWRKLVANWDDIEELLTSEIGDIATGKGNAPKTYALMQELRGKS
jgi:hypothetical protein